MRLRYELSLRVPFIHLGPSDICSPVPRHKQPDHHQFPPLLVTVHPVRPVQYKSLFARSKCVAEFGTRFVTMGGALHKDDPKYADGLPLPSLPSIKDAYESIRMEVVGDTFEWEVLLDRIHVKESDGLERFWTQLSKRTRATTGTSFVSSIVPSSCCGTDGATPDVPPRPVSPSAAAKKQLRLLARVQKTGAVVAKADSPFLYSQHIANRITALMKKETTRGQPFSSTEIHQLDPQIYEHGLRSCDFALWRAGSRMAKRETLLARLLRRIHTLSLKSMSSLVSSTSFADDPSTRSSSQVGQAVSSLKVQRHHRGLSLPSTSSRFFWHRRPSVSSLSSAADSILTTVTMCSQRGSDEYRSDRNSKGARDESVQRCPSNAR